MVYFVYFLIIIWFIFGILALIFPKLAKKLFGKLTYVLPMWAWGIVALIGAYVFWVLSSTISNPLIFRIFAGIAFLKAIMCIFFPKTRTRWLELPDWSYRIFGAVALFVAYYVYTLL